jgi:hypothetical protein
LLALYLGSYLVQAAEDLVWIPPGKLHRRFLGWTREVERVHVSSTDPSCYDRRRTEIRYQSRSAGDQR